LLLNIDLVHNLAASSLPYTTVFYLLSFCADIYIFMDFLNCYKMHCEGGEMTQALYAHMNNKTIKKN
jgi:hypothetical protein